MEKPTQSAISAKRAEKYPGVNSTYHVSIYFATPLFPECDHGRRRPASQQHHRRSRIRHGLDVRVGADERVGVVLEAARLAPLLCTDRPDLQNQAGRVGGASAANTLHFLERNQIAEG